MMKNKVFLIPCNYMFGSATVLALGSDGNLFGSEFGGIFGNGFCSGAIPLREDEEYLNKYESHFGEDNYEIVYVDESISKYEGLQEAIDKCEDIK